MNFMMFQMGHRKLPFEQILPYDKDDLLLMLNGELGLRLCNMQTDDSRVLRISRIMETEESVFHCPKFDDRANEFAELLDGRLERFFISKKSPYIFFDQEEQVYLQKKVFSILDTNCAVEIYMRTIEGHLKRVEYAELDTKNRIRVLSAFKKYKVRAVMDIEEYSNLVNIETKGGIHTISEELQAIMSRYPRLPDIEDKQTFKRYRRFLSKKYHPDVSKEEHAREISSQINSDFDKLESSPWYQKLKEEKNSGR